MAQQISDSAIAKATGHGFAHWLAFLEDRQAATMPHREIAILLHEEGGISHWWAQNLTITYEQHIGRRIPGQDCDGEFFVGVSKTLKGSIDDALKWWVDAVGEETAFSDIPVARGPEVTKTEKWRYWRAGLADGSRVNINIYAKADGKASLGIQHEKLESTEQVEHWRGYWKGFLKSQG